MLTVTASRIAFENRWLRLRADAVRYPDGASGEYVFVERPRYAIIAAIEDGHVWMVEQWRHPLKRRQWELPMGVAPGGDATPIEEAARIELREETGVTATTLRHLGDIAPAPALLAQTGALFLATGLTCGPQALEPTEQDLRAAALPVAEVITRILSGEINDAATVAAFGILRLREIV